jgi:hypothetical protein
VREVGIQVGEHLVAAGLPPGVACGRDTAKPAAERLVILARHAEQVGDHEQRERLGVRVAELDLAAVAELVDQRVGELPHERLVLLEAVRREQAREQCAVARVLGRIEREELARERDLVAAVRDDVGDRLALGRLRQRHERTERRDDRRERRVIGVDGEQLLDARDHVHAVVRLAHDRPALAQRGVVGRRVADQLGVGEEVAFDGIHECHPFRARGTECSQSASSVRSPVTSSSGWSSMM